MADDAFSMTWNDNAYKQITKKLRSPMGPIFQPWWESIAEEVKTIAEEQAPVSKYSQTKGQLRDSHRIVRVNQFRIDVTNVAPYAKFVHEGFRAHWPPAGVLPFPVRQVIASRDQPANPWISRAVEIMNSRMETRINEFINNNLADWFRA